MLRRTPVAHIEDRPNCASPIAERHLVSPSEGVRTEHYVAHRKQGVPNGEWFGIDNVEASPRDLAVAQGIEANDQNLAAALVTIQTAVAALLAEVAAGGTPAISQTTMDALTAAKTDFDAALATAEQNASDDTTSATPPAPTS